ncbi:MAG: arginine repressor [Pyrinomonadaceae bacterium]
MKKETRQQKILSLIRAKPIGTQQELRALLEQTGVPATQSSVSRDLEELGVVKHHGHYTVPQTNGAAVRGLLGLDRAGDNLIVARTEAGLASAVAVRIDGAALTDLVGTLAGEDTIFIAVADARTQRVAMKKIWELFS